MSFFEDLRYPGSVSSPASTAVLVFAANAGGNSAPIRTIAGGATGLSAPWFLTLQE